MGWCRGCEQDPHRGAQKPLEPAQEQTEFVAGSGEHDVDPIAGAPFEIIAPHPVALMCPMTIQIAALQRSAEHATALLKAERLHRCATNLQTDGYAAYRGLADRKRPGGPVTLAFCWARWRRQFLDIAKSPPALIATEALKRVAEFHEIEAEIRGKSAGEGGAVRQQKTKPLFMAPMTWLEQNSGPGCSCSSIAQAIRCGLNNWDRLLRFSMTAASRSADRRQHRRAFNAADCSQQKKFAGSYEGAENWVMLASLIETCKLHGVNPQA